MAACRYSLQAAVYTMGVLSVRHPPILMCGPVSQEMGRRAGQLLVSRKCLQALPHRGKVQIFRAVIGCQGQDIQAAA